MTGSAAGSAMPEPLAPPQPRAPSATLKRKAVKTGALMPASMVLYLYRKRLRVHAVQELLAGAGVAIAVALVLASTIASQSIAGSAGEVVHTVIGPASLQLRSRGSDGFEEHLLARVEHLPGVKQAAPILEQTATIRLARGVSGGGRRVAVDLAGADTSLVVLDGLAHTLPIATLSPGGLGLSTTTARALGLTDGNGIPAHPGGVLLLDLRGSATQIRVSAVLGRETFGALSAAQVAVMPLADLQRLAGLGGRVSRILVQVAPGHEAAVRSELQVVAGGALTVSAADQDVAALKQALGPANQASEFFAAISGLIGLLLAFNALLLTAPERRQAIARMRLTGTRSTGIVQMLAFQALLLGIVASAVGVLGGYLLSRGVFHESTGYLAQAFTLGNATNVATSTVLYVFAGGVLATCVASAVPLLDLRRGRALNAVYAQGGVPGNALSGQAQRQLALAAVILLALATAIFVLAPSLALLACAVLALASVCTVPLAFAGTLRFARALSDRYKRLNILEVALTPLKATTLRTLAFAATGAVALFGSVALGGARNDLLRGIHGFAHSYSADATIWVTNPDESGQAAEDFRAEDYAQRIARVTGVARVEHFQGSFLDLGNRRVWVIARPPGADSDVLRSQITGGNASQAITRLGEDAGERGVSSAAYPVPPEAKRRVGGGTVGYGWIVVSKQIAEEKHVDIGGFLTLPTPSGNAQFRLAATSTNLSWPPGVIFMSTADYSRDWQTSAPTALGVQPRPAANEAQVRHAIAVALGSSSGLEVSTAPERATGIDALAGEGLDQLGEISTLLLVAAIFALWTAGTSAVWQRRGSLAKRQRSGVKPFRLWIILLVESALILLAGCVTGALAGIYGQVVIDAYLKHITGFPVASLAASWRPLEIFVLVFAAVLALVSIPAWRAAHVDPMFGLND
jgi:putative ABC transport system permease protein